MTRGMIRTLALATLVAWLAAPAGAATDTVAATTADAPTAESPTILAYDAAWRADAVTAPPIRSGVPPARVSPPLLIGAAALLLVVVALGLTLTFRSLRTDIRRQRGLDRRREHGLQWREDEAQRR
jgi:hypothetical protein